MATSFSVGSGANKGGDAPVAQIAVQLPGVSLQEVGSFLVAVENFLHLNPHLEIRAWEQIPHPRVFIWRLQTFNELNGMLSDRTLWIRPLEQGSGYRLEYREGVKESTLVRWWQDESGTTVVELQEKYRPAKNGDKALLEVDGSLPAWSASLAGYFIGLKKWGWIPLYRWYRTQRWLTMTPTQRRVMNRTLWSIPLELGVVALLFAYWLM